MLPAGLAPELKRKILIDNAAGHLSPSREVPMNLDAPLSPDLSAETRPIRAGRRRPASKSSMATCTRPCARPPT